MYDKIAVGRRLKCLRHMAGKTQMEVAREIGISVETVRKLEQGKKGASMEVLDLLRDYYDSKMDFIMYGDN
ncbi:MAG: helix-turn-helix domain-containing protein [Clostridium sp.]|nr:helix-turn-helix domain-containing protein [Clostridium sp.]MCM1208651.1 helix-turn-helix domain-containing protein [Ruminococcus sp.]